MWNRSSRGPFIGRPKDQQMKVTKRAAPAMTIRDLLISLENLISRNSLIAVSRFGVEATSRDDDYGGDLFIS